MNASVYIIILSWNSAVDTVECLTSLSQLDYSNYHVVLVDNGSTDDTVGLTRAHFPQIQVIANGRNLGFAEGNNVGIRYALAHDADYVLLLNDDTTVAPDAITQLVRASERDPRIGMLGATVVSYVNHSCEYVGATINWDTGMTAYGASMPTATGDADYLAGCALMITAPAARAIGLLDSEYFTYFEDADWGVRCRRAGFRVVTVPSAKIYHKGTPDNVKHESPTLLFYYSRNQFRFMRKFTHGRQWRAFLFRYTRRCLTQFFGLTKRGEIGKADAVIGGFWAGVTGRFGSERLNAPAWFKYSIYWELGLIDTLRRVFKQIAKREAV